MIPDFGSVPLGLEKNINKIDRENWFSDFSEFSNTTNEESDWLTPEGIPVLSLIHI